MPFLRKYNTAITAGTAQSIKIPLIKRGVVDFAVGADFTPSAGDVKVSKDGGAAANIATLPAAVAMGNTAYWEFVFSNTELTCGTLVVTVSDSATKAVEDTEFIIETFGNASALYPTDYSRDLGVALPTVAAGASGGLLISGSNSGTTTLAALTVTGTFTISDGIAVTRSSSNTSAVAFTGNGTGHGLSVTSGSGATGNGINATSSATNGHAVNLAGAGTGDGFKSTGGATGHGVEWIGGGTSGDGLKITTTSGHGLNIVATGTTKHGALFAGGATTSHGISATGGGVGHGILATSGGGSTGDGIRATAASTNGNALNLIGVGTGAGLLSTGGATGQGALIVGGGTSGDGIKVTTTSGHGVNLAPVGTSMHGLLSTGGNGGTSDGIKASAGTGGVDIRGNITGNVTGNLSGTVTTVTTVTNQLTAAAIATGIWQDATAGDFTAANSIGKSIMNGVSLGTGLTVNDLTTKTGFSLVNGSFVTATFGTCDFTATMKTSIGTAVAASAVASVTGNVGGNVTGSVGSVASGGISAASFAAGAIDAAALAADAGTEIGTAVWASATRTLTAGTNINGSTFTAIPWNAAWDAEVQSECEDAIAANASVAAILADTNELQTDWTNGGRLDLLVDAILDDTGSSGVVVASGSKSGYTISGTTTTLDALYVALYAARADFGLSAAGVRTAVGLASANLDMQLADLPTNAELTTALTGPLSANVTQVNSITISGSGTTIDPWGP